MDKISFKKVINDILVPFGFKRKGTQGWIRKGETISTRVYLQKSNYGLYYYLHEYYIINKLHVDNSEENECYADFKYSDEKLLMKMCDLENDVPDDVREVTLKSLINEAFYNHHYIETEVELKELIIKRLIPESKVVMDYLGIDSEEFNKKWKKSRVEKMMQHLVQSLGIERTSNYELCNEELGLSVEYNSEDHYIQIMMNTFVNPYTQDIEKVYQQRLDRLYAFTEVSREKAFKEVEKIEASKPSKLGFIQVTLIVLEHCATDEVLKRLKDVILQIHSEQVPNESPVWFRAKYNGSICYFETKWWRLLRAVIKDEQGYKRYDFSNKMKCNQNIQDIVTGDYDQLEDSEAFELISSTEFNRIWNETELTYQPEPFE